MYGYTTQAINNRQFQNNKHIKATKVFKNMLVQTFYLSNWEQAE